jgi:hypothetical protein
VTTGTILMVDGLRTGVKVHLLVLERTAEVIAPVSAFLAPACRTAE